MRRWMAALTQSPDGKLWSPLDLTALEAEITRDEQADSSAKTLIKTLFDEVEAHKNDPVAIQALVDRVRATTDGLAAAVVAGTPAAPGQ